MNRSEAAFLVFFAWSLLKEQRDLRLMVAAGDDALLKTLSYQVADAAIDALAQKGSGPLVDPFEPAKEEEPVQ